MHKSLRNIIFNSILLLAAVVGAACSLTNAETGNSTGSQNGSAIVSENKTTGDETNRSANRQSKPAPPVTPASVAGNYTLNTLKKGFGNDNSLEIENKGNGKLGIFLSGSLTYKNGDVESAHEDEAKGEAQLQGNVASGSLNQDDRHCRITITFAANQATVKTASGCLFSISFDGVYKKEKSAKETPVETSNLPEVEYDKLNDFINDFDNHQPGERYTIVNIPGYLSIEDNRADKFGNASYKGLYYLQLKDTVSGEGETFLVSAAMIKSLDANVNENEPAALRATATLIESNGEFDVYRMSFVTKLEGLNDDGSVKWTATGAEPTKIKFTH